MKQHFLLTKYNAALQGGSGKNLQHAWLAERLELFTQGPLASIKAQTQRPDAWLLFVDAATPRADLDSLRQVLGDWGELILIEGVISDALIGQVVATRLHPRATVLLTTRLDSDDAIAPTVLERVRAAGQSYRGFLNVPHGLQLAGSAVRLRTDRSSAFLSFVEEIPTDRPVQTVFCVEHYRARDIAPMRSVKGAYHVQVVHGGNLANQLDGVRIPWRVASRLVRLDIVRPSSDADRPPRSASYRGLWNMLRREIGALVGRR